MWDNLDETGVSEHFMKDCVSVRHGGTVRETDVTGIRIIPGGKNTEHEKHFERQQWSVLRNNRISEKKISPHNPCSPSCEWLEQDL